jgi:hypothetical protein
MCIAILHLASSTWQPNYYYYLDIADFEVKTLGNVRSRVEFARAHKLCVGIPTVAM